MIRRILAMLHARNLEFLRDRAALAWNLILPVMLVFGLAFIFSGGDSAVFKVAVMDGSTNDKTNDNKQLNKKLHPFLNTRYIDFYVVTDIEPLIKKVGRHQVDMLLDLRPGKHHYWINSDSSKGYFLEQLLVGSKGVALEKQTVEGEQVRYVDWVVPGILGMNIMFSCLFGVGFVIVRYRKNGYLKRLNATPLSALEFIISQVLSRMTLVIVITCILYVGTDIFMDFTMNGSYLDLFIILLIGTTCMISLGLLIAARVSNEELAGGLLNAVSWPMMILSGVWFSMEGTHPILRYAAEFSPLTHTLSAARAIMLDGASLTDLGYQVTVLSVMTVLLMFLGARFFKWTVD